MIYERINTCLSLFNSCNSIEEFVKILLKYAKKIEKLSELEQAEFIQMRETEIDSNEEEYNSLYKLATEIKNINRPDADVFQKMIISLSALFISLYKEKIIDKDNNKQLSLKVNNYDYNAVLEIISKRKNNKIYIDDIEFDNALQCLDFLRNKLLHGDYHILGNTIILKKDNKVGKIQFLSLINFCFMLSNLSKCNGKTIEDNMVVITHVVESTATLKEFFRRNLFCVNFKFTIKGKRSLNMDIVRLMNEVEDLVMHYNVNYSMFLSDAVNKALSVKERELNECKCRVEYEITPYILKDNANDVINRFISEYKSYDDKGSLNISDMLNYFNSNSFVNKRDTLNYSFLSFSNLLLQFMPNLVFNKVEKDLDDDNIDEVYGVDIPFNLLKFYCYFNYGLDQIFSDGVTTNLRDILEGKKFDYSQLDLSLFEDNNMTIDHTITSYQDQVNGITNEYNKALKAYQKVLNSYNGFKNRFGDTKPEVEVVLFQNCEKARELLQRVSNLYNKCSCFDFNKYVKNLNIINHLRNSIAHGNYELDDSDKGNIYYVFNDIYNGVTTYTLRIKVEDFKKIFDSKNLIENYLDSLATNYLGKSSEILKYEELLLDSFYVKEDKKTEWNAKVKDAIDNNDMNELRKLNLTNMVMREMNTPSLYIKSFDKFISAISTLFSTFFSFSTIHVTSSHISGLFNESITISDYYEIVKNILEYFEGMNMYEEFIIEHVLPVCEEGSFLKDYYKSKGLGL